MRFYQWQNFRQLFWEAELRTVSQGHPDYRFIEQEKYRLIKERFPLIASYMLVDSNDYAIARGERRRGFWEREADHGGTSEEALRASIAVCQVRHPRRQRLPTIPSASLPAPLRVLPVV